jgi:DNA-directed RNA polymerase subunit L
MLLRNPKIRFAGYRKPHPLENKVEIKVIMIIFKFS